MSISGYIPPVSPPLSMARIFQVEMCFFFSSFFRTVCFHFPFPLIVRFLNFLFAPEKIFLLPLYEDDKEKFSNSMAVGDPPMF